MSVPLRTVSRRPSAAAQAGQPFHPPLRQDPCGNPPPVLRALLAATDPRAQDEAWERFLEAYSGLLLRSAFHSGRSYDGAMDRYLFILDRLRSGNFRRLRRFQATGTARFTTWLVVVARRLCLDQARRQYGRSRGEPTAVRNSVREIRRRLADLATEQVDVADLEAGGPDGPEVAFATRERSRVLEAVLRGLDTRSQLLLKLRFENNLTAREISELMGYPSQFHVYRELKLVLGRVRSGLLAAGIDEPCI